jgi:putative transposase
VLAAHDITPSMSRVGNPYDNAKAERFMRTLKAEQIDGTLFRDRQHAERSIGTFIDRIYNSQRLHTALDYRSPAQFEAWHRANSRPGADDAALGKGSATLTPHPLLDPNAHRDQARQ